MRNLLLSRAGTVLLLAALCTFSLGACQTDNAKPDAAPAALSAKDYFPLAVGNAWTYRADPAPEGTPDDVITIVKRDPDGYFVDNLGNRLQGRSNGIFDGERFILEDPLEVGHTWMAVQDVSAVERYEIVETGLKVSTAMGFHKDCVRVRAAQKSATEDGVPVTIEVLWTYAPNVGLIRLKQQIIVGAEAPREMGRRELIRFTSGKNDAGGDKAAQSEGNSGS